MKAFLFRAGAVAAGILALHYLILFTVRSPIPAEYWLREFAVVKLHQAQAMTSPKIIFSGGSTTLFGIDAADVQRELGRPAINLGLHAGMRLEDHLALARAAAQPGDILILCLEPAYYDYYTTYWTTWAFRNAIAWNPASLDALTPAQRALVYFTASDPSISYDLAVAAIDKKFFPKNIAARRAALQPEPQVVAAYLAECGTAHDFNYSLANLDANGDLLNARSGEDLFNGDAWPLTRPAHVSAYAHDLLVPFLADMKAKGVRVYFDYTPYLLRTPPRDNDWQAADRTFRQELGDIGGILLEKREDLFFPIEDFYHSNLHLNEVGRSKRTPKLIDALRPIL